MKTARYLGALVAVALLASACGDDDKSSGGERADSDRHGREGAQPDRLGGLRRGRQHLSRRTTGCTPFQDQTGCVVKSKIAATSDEMFQLMSTSEYDGVSASGDASVRLIDAGARRRRSTRRSIKNYADLSPFLKDTEVQHERRQELRHSSRLGRQLPDVATPTCVTTGPDSWSVVFDKASPYAGKVTAYDAPIYIADAALYLKSAQPDLGIDDPYSLNQAQFDAVGGPAQGSAHGHRRVLERLHQDAGRVRAGLDGARHDVAGHQATLRLRTAPRSKP